MDADLAELSEDEAREMDAWLGSLTAQQSRTVLALLTLQPDEGPGRDVPEWLHSMGAERRVVPGDTWRRRLALAWRHRETLFPAG